MSWLAPGPSQRPMISGTSLWNCQTWTSRKTCWWPGERMCQIFWKTIQKFCTRVWIDTQVWNYQIKLKIRILLVQFLGEDPREFFEKHTDQIEEAINITQRDFINICDHHLLKFENNQWVFWLNCFVNQFILNQKNVIFYLKN